MSNEVCCKELKRCAVYKSFLKFLVLSMVVIFPSSAFADTFFAEIVDVDGNAYISTKSGKTPPLAKPKKDPKDPKGAKHLEGKPGDELGHLYQEGQVINDEGKVFVAPGKSFTAMKGQMIFPGDIIETKPGAEVELLYEDGNVSRIGENSKVTLGEMVVDKKSRRTIINLAVGAIKNSVLKLSNSQSKFEVHSKTAVAGVTGTPHWIFTSSPDFEPKVNVSLLVAKNDKSKTQGVFVRPAGKSDSALVLRPGFKTEVSFGKAPLPPEAMSEEEIDLLSKMLPIKTGMSSQREKRREFDLKWGFASDETAKVKPVQEEKEEAAPEQEKPKFGKDDYKQVQFASTPEGAEVYVDGQFLGNTPLSIPVKDGVHNVRIFMDGYSDWNKKMTISADSKVSATLSKKK